MAALAAVLPVVDAAETYRNPVIDENLADPAVIRHDGTYYLYATGEVDGDNGYRVYTSADLVNWKRGPVVFRPVQRHVGAPDVWRDPASGRFYLYYTASMTVGVADAEGPLGPFTVRNKLFDNAIDAHLFRDGDGRLYLYFVQLPGFRITVQPMASPTEPAGEPGVVFKPESEWETRNGHVTEGRWMIKHSGRYYLLYSGSGADAFVESRQKAGFLGGPLVSVAGTLSHQVGAGPSGHGARRLDQHRDIVAVCESPHNLPNIIPWKGLNAGGRLVLHGGFHSQFSSNRRSSLSL